MIVYRRADGWGQLVCSGPDGDVEFRSINLVLTLREVYDDILEP
jgi:hypothetical protein